MRQIRADVALGDVGNVNHRLHREQRRVGKHGALVLGHLKRACAFPRFERLLQALQQLDLGRQRLVALHGFFGAVDAAVDQLKVREDQFQIDGFHVAQRVDIAVHMDNVVVLEAADDVNDRIGLADVGQELVAEAFPLGSAAHKPGNVNEFDNGRRIFLGVIHVRQDIQALVRYSDDAYVRIDRAERIVCRLRACVGECVEQRALADIRQADDTKFHM